MCVFFFQMLFALALSSIYHVTSSYGIFCTLLKKVNIKSKIYILFIDKYYKICFLCSQNYFGALIVLYYMLHSLFSTYLVSVGGQNLINEASQTNRVVSKLYSTLSISK